MPKRRKKSRPAREPGLPVSKQMRDDLIMPVHAALVTLRVADDAQYLDEAFNTLAAFVNTMRVMVQEHPRLQDELEAVTDAMLAIEARQKRTGLHRASGEELTELRRFVTWTDENLGLFRTNQLKRAIVAVYDALHGETV